jgi:hypothetical protein
MDGICQGLCKGDRSATEGPARWAFLPGGKRILYCPCCNKALVYQKYDLSIGGAPNIRPEVERESEHRFSDDICGYDTVVLVGLK